MKQFSCKCKEMLIPLAIGVLSSVLGGFLLDAVYYIARAIYQLPMLVLIK